MCVDQYLEHSGTVFALSAVFEVAGFDIDLLGLRSSLVVLLDQSNEFGRVLATAAGSQRINVRIDNVAGSDQQFIAGSRSIGDLSANLIT